jgi:hypothetical protein
MKNREDKNMDKLIASLVSETSVESPSVDFTAKVMSGVFAVEKNTAFVYKPAISKKAWLIIFGIIIALFAVLLFNTQLTSADNNFNLAFLHFDKFPKVLTAFQFSTLTANILFAASVMVFIQAFLLKTYLNKKFHKHA